MKKKVPGVQRPCSRGDGKLNAMATMTHRPLASLRPFTASAPRIRTRTPARTHNM